MNTININEILERKKLFNDIKDILDSFETNCKSLQFKKGIYIYGSPGCGKTHFVMNLLTQLNYDIIKYDAGDVRNKGLIDTITSNNISNCNVLQLMNGKIKRIAIVMDEIDGMNNGDKGGITSLIKLIRQKKTKKQKTENVTLNPIICIGNYYIDKKIKELMKVCNVFELKTPTVLQIENIMNRVIPIEFDHILKTKILQYIQGDMRKLEFIVNIYKKKPELLNDEILNNILIMKSYNYDTKKIAQTLINTDTTIEEHNHFMNETERTIVSLLYHENIIEPLQMISKEQYNKLIKETNEKTTTNDVDNCMENMTNIELNKENITIKNQMNQLEIYDFYLKILDNICYADYIDRVTFQNQIWVFNEMSSLIKTFYNNYLYHKKYPEYNGKFQPTEVRFTKVLTKYSTEYNNQLFMYNFCQELNMDRKDVIAFFQELRLFYGKNFYNQTDVLNRIMNDLFQSLKISKLDIKRIYRYLDKNVKTMLASHLITDTEVDVDVDDMDDSCDDDEIE